jgi:hypothetical protein
MKTENRPKVRELLTTLIESCEEGMSGEWDAGSEEGRESFEPMIDHLTLALQSHDALVEACKLAYERLRPRGKVKDTFHELVAHENLHTALKAAGVEL